MPKRTDLQSIMIIGAGPIVIGQACEFDYSGTQACKALREEGYRVILVNSNPATIMTDPDMADATYIEPITPEVVARIIEKERPDALLPTMGGQTALNTALALASDGTLEKFNCEMIGADATAIDKAEDRLKFRQAMDKIGLESPRSSVAHSLEEALDGLDYVLPAIIRPSFTMGGTGGGVAYNKEEFIDIVSGGLSASPTQEVLIEESVIGWKEYEMEVVRDRHDNCIIICSIENIDPMGVHTGDSITVAPALTMTDKEYQIMRNASIAVLREIGVETGGSNVQFALNPENGRLVVIEMNPRVSRSSALASKATGFPIAKVATKLAIGYTLDEITNDITGATPASFEPTIDYVVTKIPRFAFEKFKNAKPLLTTAMKSVGEVMAIGRSFPESLQKALRGLENGLSGLDPVEALVGANPSVIEAELARPTPDRLLVAAQALREGLPAEKICEITHYDPWFIARLAEIIAAENEVISNGLPLEAAAFRRLKAMGFSDKRLADLALQSAHLRGLGKAQAKGSGIVHDALQAMTGGVTEAEVRTLRHSLNIRPVFKRIDSARLNLKPKRLICIPLMKRLSLVNLFAILCQAIRKKVVILGGGPNRIGQGLEFDYCCCHACFALEAAGYETIMVNCNPETVSTDYDTSDRLYFEPLTGEDVLEILHTEQKNGTLVGVIVQFGGQTPLKLAAEIEKAGIPILGTSPDAIDLAEDRERFSALVSELGLLQPANGIARSRDEAISVADKIGYPILIRPSYVLGGRAMEIIDGPSQLDDYIHTAVKVSGESPVLIDQYLRDATEVDVDAVADGDDVVVAGILQHIEEAGIHSGDSACSIPPYSLPASIIEEIKSQTDKLARALKVQGLMNIQFAVKGDKVYLIEVNPRASRTVPFVAKADGRPVAQVAARVMAGEKLRNLPEISWPEGYTAVKEAVFPWARFPGVDIDFPMAFAKAQLAAGNALPRAGTFFISVKDSDKAQIVEPIKALTDLGIKLVATDGTARYLQSKGVPVERVNKVREGRPHIVDLIKDGAISLVVNTTEGWQSLQDSASIRSSVVLAPVPYFTTAAAAIVAAEAIVAIKARELEVRSLQSYHSMKHA
nr:carbamoylphosphate synthetase large subunit [Zymomonas mobilis subsp. mobilis ZM4 = ATCC 31821]